MNNNNENYQPYQIVEHYYLHAKIKPSARLLLLYIKSNAKHHKPSQSAMASNLGMSVRTVIRSLDELVEQKIIKIKAKGKGKKYDYTINDVSKWRCGFYCDRSKKAQTSDKKSQPKPVTKSHKGSDKKSAHSSNNKEVTLSNNISSSKENKTTTIKKVADLCEENMASDGWYSYKNAIKIYEQLGEDKFIEFLEYANYLNHHKKSDYKRTFGNVERAIYSFNGR